MTVVGVRDLDTSARSPRFLGSLFRVLGWVTFVIGATFSGGAFFWILGFDEGFWGIFIAAVIGLWFAYLTFILWGFLLLLAAIADYLRNRTQFIADGDG